MLTGATVFTTWPADWTEVGTVVVAGAGAGAGLTYVLV